MSDEDALLAAICQDPDEDTPRLVYADWLEESDRRESAEFVRAQVELARTPEWEPFAVFCKWRRSEWFTGNSFRKTLPPVDGFAVEWHKRAFRRGFGWHLNVRSPVAWERVAPHIHNRATVGEMHLWSAATLDDWRRFAASSEVRQLRRLHFPASPIEPLRALREAPNALGITDIFFERAGGAGMPEVVEDLLASPLGRAVRGLHFRVGYTSVDLLIEVLAAAQRLDRLSFESMGLTAELMARLTATTLFRNLHELHLRNEYSLGNEGFKSLAAALPSALQDLTCSYVGVQADGIASLASAEQLGNLRRLNLSKNTLTPRAAKLLASSRNLSGLRSLIVNRCQLGDKGVRHLIRSKFWRNLVEIDLRENTISRAGIGYLLDAPVPGHLTALIVDFGLGAESQRLLRKKYGDALVLAHTEEE